MKKNEALSLILFTVVAFSAAAWKPVEGHISTRWAADVQPEKPWDVYPRPIMERNQWENLNGLWQYAIVPKGDARPAQWQGEILVPFAVESSLSGVGRHVTPDEALWYERSFTVPSSWKGKDVLLNFGAVDWACEVWVNEFKAGSHKGGYAPFSLNITPALKQGSTNTLTVRVTDPSTSGPQPLGKQTDKPSGCFYTNVTGIWQTVWLEPVARANHINSLHIVPDIDTRRLSINVSAAKTDPSLTAKVRVSENGRTVASGSSLAGQPVELMMPADMKLWSPDSPTVYDLDIEITSDGKTIDHVRSYAAMRKVSTARDNDGIVRLMLNNKPIFHFGPLDQGWWPDGLYTAPTYEAMFFDIDKTKDLGYNMIRKHVKVEPATWYTYCDRKGILVWQDMPNGDRWADWNKFEYYDGVDKPRSAESENIYRREWKEIMDVLKNYPSIAVWVPFNEGWGQFKTPEIVNWTKEYDPTRLVNPASGGNHYPVGDMLDIHHYPDPRMLLIDPGRANVLGEYGGIGMAIKDHVWNNGRNWGYVEYNSINETTDQYAKYIATLLKLARAGYSAAVYTQTTDVENEVNGLLTYDREILKFDEDKLRKINSELSHCLDNNR